MGQRAGMSLEGVSPAAVAAYSESVRGRLPGAAILALVAIAGYSVYVIAVAASGGKGHGSVFWTAIGMFVLIAVGALGLAYWIYGSRLANRNGKPS